MFFFFFPWIDPKSWLSVAKFGTGRVSEEAVAGGEEGAGTGEKSIESGENGAKAAKAYNKI